MKYEQKLNRVWRSFEEYFEVTCARPSDEDLMRSVYCALPDATISYDSTADTQTHIRRVSILLTQFATQLLERANKHDDSKLVEPEKSHFDRETPLLKGLTYGSVEYRESLDRLGIALKHHYKYNSHHPEHYENGVDGMDLVDLVEMLLDWKAASERHADGNAYKSLEVSRQRFGLSDQLYQILVNTLDRQAFLKTPKPILHQQ